MLESGLERKFVTWCSRNGVVQTKLYDLPGYPDRIVWAKGGVPLLIEFKSPSGTLSLKQKIIHDRLIGLGYRVYVIRTYERLLEVLANEMVATSLPEDCTRVPDKQE